MPQMPPPWIRAWLRNGSIFSHIQSSFEISLRKASSADCGWLHRTHPTPVKAGVILRSQWGVVSSHTRFLCILHVKNVVGILLANIVRKKIHYTITHPLPSLECVTPCSNMITATHAKYSNCIRYNFFIYCPICMKFAHNILHTYSFILSIIKHNWKIRRFWVVDPLKHKNNVI